ncbi:MAG: FAD-dependent oxidoreductase, partial [Albidovulum sp.]
AIDRGIAQDGAFYLFTLRLIPVIPFFAVNLLMGLTPIRAVTFYLVSQIGMLAGTAVYVNAGTRLSELTSVSGILSWRLLVSFALLGLFPWVAKFALGLVRHRRAYAGYKRPARFDRNLIVIGAGAAGLVSAYVAAAVKAKVTIVEANRMGGDCLNFGCVPSKALIRSARLAHQMRHADRYGLEPVEPGIPFRRVFARIRDVIAAIEPHDSAERYERLGVEVIKGHARLVDPWTVEIARGEGRTDRMTSRAIILATGAAPAVPPLPGLETVGYLTSDTLWEEMARRETAPRRLVVLGGGPIGCELAQSFARLGSKVTQIEMLPRLLIREDADAAEAVRAALVSDGVTVLTGHRARAFGLSDGEKWIEVEADGAWRRIGFDDVIIAVGRAARLTGYGLEDLGIPTGKVIETNEWLETRFPNIYAVGDAAGPYQFTHIAAHQAWFASINALFGVFRRFRVDYRVIPWATFTDPEVARVGLSETEAKAKGIAFEVTRYGIEDLDRAIADGSAEGFVKVLTPPGKDRILGATIVGAHAADLLAEFVFAMKHGKGLGAILSAIHIYPTLAEANRFVAGEWRRAHVNPRALALLERFHAWRRG